MGQPRKISESNKRFHAGVGKQAEVKKKEQPVVGPVVLGIFVFVVIGSALLQIFKAS